MGVPDSIHNTTTSASHAAVRVADALSRSVRRLVASTITVQA